MFSDLGATPHHLHVRDAHRAIPGGPRPHGGPAVAAGAFPAKVANATGSRLPQNRGQVAPAGAAGATLASGGEGTTSDQPDALAGFLAPATPISRCRIYCWIGLAYSDKSPGVPRRPSHWVALTPPCALRGSPPGSYVLLRLIDDALDQRHQPGQGVGLFVTVVVAVICLQFPLSAQRWDRCGHSVPRLRRAGLNQPI